MSHTYSETVLRYRVVVHEELPESHKALYRLHGIDPDKNFRLVWSFHELADAEAQLAIENENKADFQTWKIVDAGQAETIERQAWF